MAYKIEDIDWDKMPEGAVEFALEDEEHFLTWYDGYGNSWMYLDSLMRVDDLHKHNRERYKVSDYHPSATARKPTREERLDKALRALIQTHFFGYALEWNWKEGKTLEDLDPSLHNEIDDLLKIREE